MPNGFFSSFFPFLILLFLPLPTGGSGNWKVFRKSSEGRRQADRQSGCGYDKGRLPWNQESGQRRKDRWSRCHCARISKVQETT